MKPSEDLAYRREYYHRTKKRMLARRRARYRNDPEWAETLKTRVSRWQKSNREKLRPKEREKHRRWRANFPEKARAKYRRDYLRDPEARYESARRWLKKHPDLERLYNYRHSIRLYG